jgi:prefoldin subunit 5
MNEPTPDEIEQIKAQLVRIMNAFESLVESLQHQTKAINAMVQSNAMLLQALAETAMDGEELPANTYLDGSPR